ncbi:MAG TPA: STAS domain-containing protein [Streptosporangiaceae bacterium]|nr:STAS domain-containing protein [Streptosporangiaceae bacterium]
MDMAIIIQDALQDCTIVQICGELDISTAPDLRERLLAILSRKTVSRLILDLSKLEFMDSSGVAVLVNTERRARLLGRTVVLVAPQRPVLRVLQICGIDHCFPIFDDINAAAVWPQADLPGPLQSGDAPEAGDSDCALA